MAEPLKIVEGSALTAQQKKDLLNRLARIEGQLRGDRFDVVVEAEDERAGNREHQRGRERQRHPGPGSSSKQPRVPQPVRRAAGAQVLRCA